MTRSPNRRLLVVVAAFLGVVVLVGVVLLSGVGPGGGFPPGANGSGFSPSLADTHDARLERTDSFTYRATTVAFTDEGVRNESYLVRVERADHEFFSRRIAGPGSRGVTRYYDNGTLYVRRKNDSGTFYRVVEDVPSPIGRFRRLNRTIGTLAREGNFTHQGRTSVGGRTGHRYVADDVDPVVTGRIPARNVSAELVVGSNGLVVVFELTFEVRRVDATRRTTIRGRFTDVGTTSVSRPDWVSEATEPSVVDERGRVRPEGR